MSNIATDALANALEMARKWRSKAPESPPAYGLEMPAATESGGEKAPPRSHDAGAIGSTQTLMEAGQVSAKQLVDDSLAAISERNDDLYAFVEIMEVAAREAATRLDQERASGRLRGPLHGIPVSVKDLYAVRGATTHAGSIAFEQRDRADAAAVRKLRDAGAVIIGKTATHEFAMGVTAPQSRNPHDRGRIAGGSSSGAAIAVSTGMGLGAIGTDTRGSIRIPAALCGVVGLKPTYGSVSMEGVLPLSWTMDHAGVIAPTVSDAALILDAIATTPIPAGTITRVQGMRIGLPRAAWSSISPDVDDSVNVTLATLEAAGAELVEVERPSATDFDQANLMSMIVSRCEAAAFHADLDLDMAMYSADVRSQLQSVTGVEATAYINAQRYRAELMGDLTAACKDVDVLLMPTVPIVAPTIEEAAQTPLVLTRNVALWSFVGFPALSVPGLPAPSGLTTGLQIVAAPHAEAAIITVGRAVERGVNAR
jgi:aspartyl-tRNA(Asn)/glutamyl-tRNA(Gln) amidotransferase subunit A